MQKSSSQKTSKENVSKIGLTITFLKWLALITMIVDHVAVTIQSFLPAQTYIMMRGIGRIAFPLFVFCMVEGFLHTRCFWKYFLRVGIFAVISEVPFDLLVTQKYYVDFSHNNVLWTFLGLLAVLHGIQMLRTKFTSPVKYPLMVVLAVGVAGLCKILHTDYSWGGIALGLCFFLLRDRKVVMYLVATCIFLLLSDFTGIIKNGFNVIYVCEVFAVLSFIPISLYDGRKSLIDHELPRLFFYFLYPGHMLLLGLYGVLLRAGI